MTNHERQLLGSKLYSFLYPKSNFYKLNTESANKYEEAAENLLKYFNTVKETK